MHTRENQKFAIAAINIAFALLEIVIVSMMLIATL